MKKLLQIPDDTYHLHSIFLFYWSFTFSSFCLKHLLRLPVSNDLKDLSDLFSFSFLVMAVSRNTMNSRFKFLSLFNDCFLDIKNFTDQSSIALIITLIKTLKFQLFDHLSSIHLILNFYLARFHFQDFHYL